MREKGLQARGAYKEVPRASQRLALATPKSPRACTRVRAKITLTVTQLQDLPFRGNQSGILIGYQLELYSYKQYLLNIGLELDKEGYNKWPKVKRDKQLLTLAIYKLFQAVGRGIRQCLKIQSLLLYLKQWPSLIYYFYLEDPNRAYSRILVLISIASRFSLVQQQNLVKYNGKLLELYNILFSFLYTIIIQLGLL